MSGHHARCGMRIIFLLSLLMALGSGQVFAQPRCIVNLTPAYQENCHCTGYPDVRRACYAKVTELRAPCGEVCEACNCTAAVLVHSGAAPSTGDAKPGSLGGLDLDRDCPQSVGNAAAAFERHDAYAWRCRVNQR